MNVGFTGSQNGMTDIQCDVVRELLREFRTTDDDEFHYGACIGADSQAVLMALDLGYVIIAYQANDVPASKHGLIPHQAVLVKPMPALKRDDLITSNIEILVAAPQQVSEQLRSGTWATVRRARKRSKPIVYVWPDGRIQR